MSIHRDLVLLLLSLCVARQNMMVKHMVEIVVDRRQMDGQTDRQRWSEDMLCSAKAHQCPAS